MRKNVALVCHPHPKLGGNAQNNVVVAVTRQLANQVFSTMKHIVLLSWRSGPLCSWLFGYPPPKHLICFYFMAMPSTTWPGPLPLLPAHHAVVVPLFPTRLFNNLQSPRRAGMVERGT